MPFWPLGETGHDGQASTLVGQPGCYSFLAGALPGLAN